MARGKGKGSLWPRPGSKLPGFWQRVSSRHFRKSGGRDDETPVPVSSGAVRSHRVRGKRSRPGRARRYHRESVRRSGRRRPGRHSDCHADGYRHGPRDGDKRVGRLYRAVPVCRHIRRHRDACRIHRRARDGRDHPRGLDGHGRSLAQSRVGADGDHRQRSRHSPRAAESRARERCHRAADDRAADRGSQSIFARHARARRGGSRKHRHGAPHQRRALELDGSAS